MRTIDAPFQQNSVTYCLELQIKFVHLQSFVEFFEQYSETIVYFEAEETKRIESEADDLWHLEVYFETEPNLNDFSDQLKSITQNYNIEVPHLTKRKIVNHDWVSEVQKTFVPIDTGKFFIHHDEYDGPIPDNKIIIKINAGRAFGTGEHETTSNCLKALSELATENNYKNCLDMGCGSGILAIAMAKLWPNQITAVDLDEQAVMVTRENIHNNKVSFIIIDQSDGYQHPILFDNKESYQLITANILANPLIEMAADSYKYLQKDGILILAGFINEQKDNVLQAHLTQGFSFVKEIVTENWPALILKK